MGTEGEDGEEEEEEAIKKNGKREDMEEGKKKKKKDAAAAAVTAATAEVPLGPYAAHFKCWLKNIMYAAGPVAQRHADWTVVVDEE